MNRTLIPPVFFSRGAGDPMVAANHHVDMDKLGELLTIESNSKFGDLCDSSGTG